MKFNRDWIDLLKSRAFTQIYNIRKYVQDVGLYLTLQTWIQIKNTTFSFDKNYSTLEYLLLMKEDKL